MRLVTERIAQHCRRLRLTHLATEWPAIAEACAKSEDSLADFMDKLLAAECTAREQRTREAMLKLATLPAIKTLEAFDCVFASGTPRKQITELGVLAFIERHDARLIGGPQDFTTVRLAGHIGRYETDGRWRRRSPRSGPSQRFQRGRVPSLMPALGTGGITA